MDTLLELIVKGENIGWLLSAFLLWWKYDAEKRHRSREELITGLIVDLNRLLAQFDAKLSPSSQGNDNHGA